MNTALLLFSRLLTTFVLRIADPRIAAGEPCQLPLPEKPSMEFRQLPVGSGFVQLGCTMGSRKPL